MGSSKCSLTHSLVICGPAVAIKSSFIVGHILRLVSPHHLLLVSRPTVEITDGWYPLGARVDEVLAHAARRSGIRVGSKIAVCGTLGVRFQLLNPGKWNVSRAFKLACRAWLFSRALASKALARRRNHALSLTGGD